MADTLFDENALEATINEEYKIWKKNAPFLYDLAISHELEWPSLSVQWLPKKELATDYSIHKLIIGTHTSQQETNLLKIAKVRLPKDDSVQLDSTEYKQGENIGIGLANGESKIEIETEIVHDGEVNRARYQPSKPTVIATFTSKGEIHLFDYALHPSKPKDQECRPNTKLVAHTQEGYGLDWNKFKDGTLLSSGNDGKICVWDLESTKEPKLTYQLNHPVEDVKWHGFHPEVFGSCGDDRHVRIYDNRKAANQPLCDIQTHSGDIYTIDFNMFNEYLLLTGSEDRKIQLIDLRNTEKPLHTFEGHNDQVMTVKWSPHSMKVFASCSVDRRAMIWDFGRCGQPQTQEEMQDGPPELLFIHGGHRSKVLDLDWNPNEKYVLSSAEDNNILQVWQLGQHIYCD